MPSILLMGAGSATPSNGPPAPGGFLLEGESASYILLEDGISFLLLES